MLLTLDNVIPEMLIQISTQIETVISHDAYGY